MPDKKFRQLDRMEKSSFFHLVSLIVDDLVFHNRSYCQQAPMEIQLAMTLDRLGHNGNGACLAYMIPMWGINGGSMVNLCLQCFLALETALSK